MNLNKHDAQTEMEMNMTPMIDVVFLLIIFFMIITDLTQQDLEEIRLPVAQNAIPDKPDPKVVRPVINVMPDGRMIVRKQDIYEPERGDPTELERYLADAARRMPKRRYPEVPGEPLPDNPLLIRADENTEFKFLQRIMEVCGKEGIRIWKLELAAAEDSRKKDNVEE
jgi:biopolymer transport protein ExbD